MSESDKKTSNQSPKASSAKAQRPKVDPKKTIGYRNDGIDPSLRKQS